MQVEASIEIAAAPADVFAVFTDFGRSAERVSDVIASELLTAEPHRTGTRFREVRRHGKGELKFEFEIVEWDAPRSFVVRTDHTGISWITRYTFEPRGSRTDVSLVMKARPIGVGGWLLMPMILLNKKTMQTAMQADLRDMEKATEAATQ